MLTRAKLLEKLEQQDKQIELLHERIEALTAIVNDINDELHPMTFKGGN